MNQIAMKYFMFSATIILAVNLNAQSYLISFSGVGAASTVTSVKVENLDKGTTLNLNGNDILRLNVVTGINSIMPKQSSGIKIYPNPMNLSSIMEINPPFAGDATVSVYEITGKLCFHLDCYLENSFQEFRLKGFNNGIYLINVKSKTYQLTGKFICNGSSYGIVSVEKINSIVKSTGKDIPTIEPKGLQVPVDMDYSIGNRIRFVGATETYRTVVSDIPSSDRTISFSFVACIDGDNNNYQEVAVGDQVWMAENLKTTKYKNGITDIPLVSDNASWLNLTTPGYCWYDNNESDYKNIYGALYNWYTVNTGNLCPTGWHVPIKTDILTLFSYFGGSIEAGGKLKETGTSHWVSPNTEATNASGLTCLPGGNRHFGSFSGIGYSGVFLSATEVDNTNAWGIFLHFSSVSASLFENRKNDGFSVRCIKD